jgi:very-short-patch-repair endonuclease
MRGFLNGAAMRGIGLILVVIAVIVFVAMSGFAKSGKRASSDSISYVRRDLMTAREFAFFGALRSALPEATVHSQVAMAALVDVKGGNRSSRNSFDRKIFDYVVCAANGLVLYAIELDDRSHSGDASRRRDELKDEIAKSAGLRVVRYQSVRTDARVLRRDYDAIVLLVGASDKV